MSTCCPPHLTCCQQLCEARIGAASGGAGRGRDQGRGAGLPPPRIWGRGLASGPHTLGHREVRPIRRLGIARREKVQREAGSGRAGARRQWLSGGKGRGDGQWGQVRGGGHCWEGESGRENWLLGQQSRGRGRGRERGEGAGFQARLGWCGVVEWSGWGLGLGVFPKEELGAEEGAGVQGDRATALSLGGGTKWGKGWPYWLPGNRLDLGRGRGPVPGELSRKTLK